MVSIHLVLEFDQIGIEAAWHIEEGFVAALFYDLTFVYDEYLICFTYRREAMRNDKGRPALHELIESILDQLL
jgi:hypothetical protein